MTTVINNPGTEGNDSGSSIVLGVIVGIVIIALFIIYGIPALRGSKADDNKSIDVNVTIPTGSPSPSPSPATN